MKHFVRLLYVFIILAAGNLMVHVTFNVTTKQQEQTFDLNYFKTFDPFLREEEKKTKPKLLSKIAPVETDLNKTEENAMKVCIKNQPQDSKKGSRIFWSGDTNLIRHRHHKYLTQDSFILEVGGNTGIDTSALFNAYKPKIYIILEPLESHFKRLVKKFENNSEITVYNIGLAKKNDEFKVSVTGTDGDATSIFQSGNAGTVSLKVRNATDFFLNVGVGFYDIDLITINCEGCEFDVLESITSTTLVRHFKHIQFATHVNLPGLEDSISRYCKLQNLLARTHKISYQHKFTWETRIRKDLNK